MCLIAGRKCGSVYVLYTYLYVHVAYIIYLRCMHIYIYRVICIYAKIKKKEVYVYPNIYRYVRKLARGT